MKNMQMINITTNKKLALFSIVFLIILTTNKLMSQEKLNLFPDLIFIKNTPKSNEIASIVFGHTFNPNTILDESKFLNALDNNAKPLNPKDEIISEWNYTPWYSITFDTPKGKYYIEMYLGGLGIMTLPSGQKGAILFDFEKNEKPSDNKKGN